MSAIRCISLAAATLVVLAGCSAPAAPGGDDESVAPEPSAFCAEFEANGGTGASIGPVQTWLPKEQLLPDVQSRVDVMADIEPPTEIAAEWAAMKTYYSDLLVAAEGLPEGGTLASVENFDALAEAPQEYEVVTDYVFASC